MKTHTFNGRKYEIDLDEAPDGYCVQYKAERELAIHADLKTRNGLITAIHEGLHACKWDASEETIDQASYDIGRFLWRLGFRLQGRK
jgi:hypothetical protein